MLKRSQKYWSIGVLVIKKLKHYSITPIFLFLFVVCYLLLTNPNAYAFSAGAAGCEADCKKCHSINNQEAADILKKMNLSHAKILNIQLSPVKSLWEISIEDKGKMGIFYVDFSKKYILPGPIVEISSGTDKTQERFEKIQEKRRVNVSKIHLKDAVVMGNINASKKVIVFTDPD
jgi:thiol:disulfide interchange protein DsbC